MRLASRITLLVISITYIFILSTYIIPTQVKSDNEIPVTYLSHISGSVNDTVQKDDVVYLAGWETIRAYDISDATNPIQIAQHYEKDCNFLSVDIEAGRLYATQGAYKCGYHLKLFDISNRSEIVEIGEEVSISNTGAPKEIVVNNSMAYLAYAQGGLSIVDTSNSNDPVIYPLFKSHPNINSDDIYLEDETVYLSNLTGGFVAISVSDPSSPTLLFDSDLPTGSLAQYNSTGISVSGSYVYLAAGAKGVKVFDISDQENIQTTTHSVTGYVRDVDAISTAFFVASDTNSTLIGGLSSYSIDDSFGVKLNDYYQHEGINKFYKVIHGGRYLFGIDITSGLYILDSGFEVSPESNTFLDLPWDYTSQGKSFDEAALSMSSYFDHEYPFVSAPALLSLDKDGVVNYDGNISERFNYSSHDGYDWGRVAGTKYGIPQVAAADGVARYVNTCKACGNAIHIDHGNGYQTRHYHLQNEGLISSDPQSLIPVLKGQQIGLTGFTGNTIPSDERGSHIHFMVVQDKDKDGNFDNNIPDGLVDPFGWKSSLEDPWETLTYEINGIQKTGNKSEYLWVHSLESTSSEVLESGSEIEFQRYKVTIPDTAYEGEFTVNLSSSPLVILNETTNSLSPSLVVVAHDDLGNPVNQFDDDIIIYFDFHGMDLSAYDLSSLQIYSSTDGNDWVGEETSVDLVRQVASVNVSHLTEFALFAQLKDTVAPETNYTIDGDTYNQIFHSSVELKFEAEDEESDIAYTAVSIDEQDWTVYESPILIDEEGDHIVKYYSEDVSGNVEDIKTLTIAIDYGFPELLYRYNKQNRKIELTAYKADDSVVTKYLSRNRFETIVSNGTDITTIRGKYNDGLVDFVKIESVSYNDTVYEFENNILSVIDSFLFINQNFRYNGEVIDLLFSRLRNKTAIAQQSGRVHEKIIKEGSLLLYVRTNNGVLEYYYEQN